MAIQPLLGVATSVDVEHAFSHGSLTVSKHHHALSDESTRAAVVLWAWSEVPGIVVQEDILKLFDKKCHQPRHTNCNPY